MRTIIMIAATALLAAPVVADPRGEAQIAKALAGRTAGTPFTCIEQHNIRDSRIIANTAILYTMRDGTILLNRPPNGTAFLRADLTLISDTRDSDRLCNVDILRLYDTTTRTNMGSIGLGDFVPYPRAGK